MNGIAFIDLVVMTVLLIALGRGLWIGLIREGLSIVSSGAATIVTRLYVDPVAVGLSNLTSGEISGRTSFWIASSSQSRMGVRPRS